MKFKLEPATDKKHKYIAIFTDEKGKETRVPFGAYNYHDYTTHKNKLRRDNYLLRHRIRENWNDPMTAGALSRWILWNTSDLHRNVSIFKQKFNLT